MRSNKILAGLGATLFTLLLTSTALADDWVATKLRGTVLALQDGAWQKLSRGDVVSDDRVIRTMRGGRVTFTRGAEVIDLGADTQVRIYDRNGRKFTTVMQDFGTVSIEAEVQAVEHFSVKTPQLAAVVKGTRFTVRSGPHDAEVSVQRGRVAVRDSDTHQSTTVVAGQSAGTSDNGAPLTVSGKGELPAVVDARGNPVEPRKAAEQTAAAAARSAALAEGRSAREADKAAREAVKQAREEAKAAEREARDAGKDAKGHGGPGNGPSGGPGKGDAGGPGKGDAGGPAEHGKGGPSNDGPSGKGPGGNDGPGGGGRGNDNGGGPGNSGRGSDGNSGPGGGGGGDGPGGGGGGGGHGGGGDGGGGGGGPGGGGGGGGHGGGGDGGGGGPGHGPGH